MKVSVHLTYSHGYFVRFPHTGADVIAHLLFVFGFQAWKQFYYEVTITSSQFIITL